MNIPSQIRAGDSYNWTELLSDYPASDGYSLKYVLINETDRIDIESSANGDNYDVALKTSDTNSYTPGKYKSFLILSKGDERITVGSYSWIEILPDLVQSTSLDLRSQNERILDSVNKALETLMTDGVVTFTIRDRSTTYTTPDQLLKLKKEFENIVWREREGGSDNYTIYAEL